MSRLRAPLRALTAIFGAGRGPDPEDPRATMASSQPGDNDTDDRDVDGGAPAAAATPGAAG